MSFVLYCRVSTQEQEADGHSLDLQESKLRQYCDLHDIEVTACIRECGSAKTLDREGLQSALQFLESGEADGLLVYKLDRLTRSMRDWGELLDKYFSPQARHQPPKVLRSFTESINTGTASGKMVLNMMMTIAQWERETIAERTTAALAHKKSKGQRTGSVPYGFNLAADRVHLVPNPIEQERMQIMVNLRRQGDSYRSIAAHMNLHHFPTKQGKSWTAMQVSRAVERYELDLIGSAN